MLKNLRSLCVFILVLILFALFSGGCGGGDSTESVSQDDSGWDIAPIEHDNNENKQNNNDATPVTINGIWEIISGHAVISDDKQSLSLTYKPGRIGEVGIEMSYNGDNYGIYSGFYTLKLTGDNVIGSNGIGTLIVDYSYDDAPDKT